MELSIHPSPLLIPNQDSRGCWHQWVPKIKPTSKIKSPTGDAGYWFDKPLTDYENISAFLYQIINVVEDMHSSMRFVFFFGFFCPLKHESCIVAPPDSMWCIPKLKHGTLGFFRASCIFFLNVIYCCLVSRFRIFNPRTMNRPFK